VFHVTHLEMAQKRRWDAVAEPVWLASGLASAPRSARLPNMVFTERI
jgi:hypothetical protein